MIFYQNVYSLERMPGLVAFTILMSIVREYPTNGFFLKKSRAVGGRATGNRCTSFSLNNGRLFN